VPAITRLSDPAWIFNLLQDIEQAVAAGLALAPCNFPVASWRRIVGWADPPEDCCPEIAVWATAIRQNPAYAPPGTEMTRAVCTAGWLVDINVRVSQCFFDTYDSGDPLPDLDINTLSADLYSMWSCAYFFWWCRWVSGQIPEVDDCTPIMINESRSYAAGGCAGVEFAITVGVDR